MSSFAWIGFDLDRTLAQYDGWKGRTIIGSPIPAMIEKAKKYLADGMRVKIFTARVSEREGREEVVAAIKAWCVEHLGQELEVTNEKDFGCIRLYDDIARQVVPNEGRVVTACEE